MDDRVRYACSCQTWCNLARMLYCRQCSALRCGMCVVDDIDVISCGSCLENVPIGESRARKNACINCHECPVCTCTLQPMSSGGGVYLSCSTCRWTTYEAETAEQPKAVNWEQHGNIYGDELTTVVEQMKAFELHEKATRDIVKTRRSNITGSRLTDRYGLQQMYQKRKQAMERPTWLAKEREPVTQLESLDLDAVTVAPDLTKSLPLDALIRQTAVGDRRTRPLRMSLQSRRFLKCAQCDIFINKLEYAPTSIVYKMSLFARSYVPEVTLSRDSKLTAGTASSVFLTVANESLAKSEVVLLADNRDDFVKCETKLVEFTLSSSDDTTDTFAGEPATENIVFRKKNKIGLRLDIVPAENTTTLGLIIKWKNELTAMNGTGGDVWREATLQISLD